MKQDVSKAYRSNVVKVYALVYSIVAIPVLYYGFNYIEMIRLHLSYSLTFLGLVMLISIMMSFIVQFAGTRHIRQFLGNRSLGSYDLSLLKKTAYDYPLYLVGVMVFGWIVLLNLFVFIPMAFIYSVRFSDLIICNLLVTSCALMSAPMTYFISEKTTVAFLSLPEVRSIPEPEGVTVFSLTTKTLLICLIIIMTLILNASASMMLSVTYSLSQAATVVNLSLIGVQGVLAAIIISLLFSRSIKRPIDNMQLCTSDVKAGKLTAWIPKLANDELGDTSVSFNSFIETLSGTVREIMAGVKATRDSVTELQRAMNDTDASVSDINLISDQVQSSVIDQSAIITEVTATMQQIARTIENQDRRINDQSASVVESSSAIEQMIANIHSIAGNLQRSSREFESLQTAIGNGNGNIGALKENVIVLSKQSDSVVEANTIIKNIASQTNLLAMNAAIEAAHAGESGRGFAVVADEIRKLAEVSNHQSKLISDSLKVLKKTIEQAVRITGETGSSFEVIIQSVQAVNGLEQEIKHAIDEQSSGSNQILQALTGINEITADVHSGSSEMLTGSNMILNEVHDLLDITERVKVSALGVVDKVKVVKQNTGRALDLISGNSESMEKIDSLVGFFTIK